MLDLTKTVTDLITSKGEQPESVKVVKKFIDANSPIHDLYCRQWYLNIANYFGRQYVVYDNRLKQFRIPLAPSWRVRLVVNKILPLARTLLSKVKEANMNFFVAPRTQDESDKSGAHLATKIVENIYFSSEFEKIKSEIADWLVLCGNTFIFVGYDPDAGKKIVTDQEEILPTGEKKKKEIYTGDIVFDPINPFEVIPDYSVTRWSEMKAICRKKIRTIQYIKEKYGVEVSAENFSTEYADYLKIANLVSANEANSDVGSIIKKDCCIVKEYWEFPSKKYPNGRHFIVSNDKELLAEDNIETEYMGKKTNPIIFAGCIEVPGKLLCMSPIENALPLQWQYNRIRSQMVEYSNLISGPRLFAEEDSVVEETYNDRPLGIVYYRRGTNMPTYAVPPNMASYVIDSLKLLITELEDVFGVHDISMGRLPRRATSGVALSILEEKDSTVVSPMKESYRLALEKLFSIALGIASDKFIESRILKIIGKNMSTEIINWNKTDLHSADDVRVIHDTNLPTSKAARLEFGINLVKNQILPPQGALKVMNLDSLSDLVEIDPSNQEERNAEYENFEMSKGNKKYPSEYEQHETHIQTHNQYLIDNTNMDQNTKNIILEHITLTKELQKVMAQGLQNPQIPANIPMMPQQNPLENIPPTENIGEGMEL